MTPAGFDSDQKIFFFDFFISVFSSFCSKFLCFDVIDCLVLKTAEFHTKTGVIEAIYVDFWLVRGFNHCRGFKHLYIYLKFHIFLDGVK